MSATPFGAHIVEKDVLKEDEFTPPLPRYVRDTIHLPLLPRVIEELYATKSSEKQRKPSPIRISDEFEKMAEEIGIREEERERRAGIIIDPLAFYVPYHSKPKLWGIYFRVEKISQDFNNFLAKLITKPLQLQQLASLCFAPYIRIIYFHEICHHVIEDVATASELYSNKQYYPFLTDQEEEGLCEYMAFTHQARSRSPFITPLDYLRQGYFQLFNIPLHTRWTLLRLSHYEKESLKLLNSFTVSELYYHWKRQSNYRPKVYPGVGAKVGPLWKSFWYSHIHKQDVLRILVRKASEVYDRIFFTYH